jgi:hypothetical protein
MLSLHVRGAVRFRGRGVIDASTTGGREGMMIICLHSGYRMEKPRLPLSMGFVPRCLYLKEMTHETEIIPKG